MRTGVRVGVDVGKARVGVALSDPHGMLATPHDTLPREGAASAIAQLVSDVQAIECVVGLPLSLKGTETESTSDARRFAEELAASVAIPVRLVDERLSTVSASAQLSGQGVRAKKQRAIVDQAAAVIILQHSLDVERAQRITPGNEVSRAE